MMPVWLFLLLCYLFGAIPFASLLTRWRTGKALHEQGTKNIGVANAFGVGGKVAGYGTVLGEISKALFPLWLSGFFSGGVPEWALAGLLAATLGTRFSPFLRFRGSKARTLVGWATFFLSPLTAVEIGLVWLLVSFLFKRSFVSLVVTTLCYPFLFWLVAGSAPFFWFGVAICVLFLLTSKPTNDDFRHNRIFEKLDSWNWGHGRSVPSDPVPLHKVRGALFGHKAANLGWLIRKGFRVPRGWVLPHGFFQLPPQTQQKALHGILDPHQAYAVRSSASVEDGSSLSFAGQLDTYLDQRGVQNILQAARKVNASLENPRFASYKTKNRIEAQQIQVHVILQPMVQPVVSGVLFTKNPITGLQETIIEGVRGSGEALVQDGVTPLRWVFKWGNWKQEPAESPLKKETLKRMVELTRTLSRKKHRDLDFEWVFDGEEVFWLQMRDITTPQQPDLFSNHISKEFLPGMIKPLVWSVNIPVVNSAWKKLFSQWIGPNNLDIYRLAHPFFYRAYFNMGVIGDLFQRLGMPRELLELLLGLEEEGPEKPRFRPSLKTMGYLPFFLLFFLGKIGFRLQVRTFLRTFRARFDAIASLELHRMETQQLQDTLDQLLHLSTRAAYFNITVPLMSFFQAGRLKRKLKKRGLDYNQLLFPQVRERNPGLYPEEGLRKLHCAWQQVPKSLQEKAQKLVDDNQVLDFVQSLPLSFQQEWTSFFQHFGYVRDSGNDFSSVPWAKTPLKVLRFAMETPPSSAQAKTLEEEKALQSSPSYLRVQQFRVLKERVSALYSYGYGLFGNLFVELGKRFCAQGVLETPEDIFFLSLEEIRGGLPPQEWTKRVAFHRLHMKRWEKAKVPDVIFGKEEPPVQFSGDTPNQRESLLKGIPGSPGYYEGKTFRVRGIQDFQGFQDEAVLVLSYSDVGFTPLFGKAGAVISASGGSLSHAAIVAREYGIPAVVSVGGAEELADGTPVRVDGYRGEIHLLEETTGSCATDPR
ncbi:MAG TPA: glycerol-3-phosphate acyltransferase [Thermotogota bacterium]|nr:glycerol-3-phosphate acyltransferase [Thermotogota bacterium]